MKINKGILISLLLLFSFANRGLVQNQETNPETYNFPPVPLFIPDNENLPVYQQPWESSESRFISGTGHVATAQYCARSVRRPRPIGESCEELWIEILDNEGRNGWILYDYNILPNEWNSSRYDSHFIPYRQRINASLDNPVSLYTAPNHESSVLENQSVVGDALVYGFAYDENGVWYLASYTLEDGETAITAWVYKSFPEHLHWDAPMPDLPYIFIVESPLAARSMASDGRSLEFTLEIDELVFIYHQAVISGYYEAGRIYAGDWQKFVIPLDAMSLSRSVSSRISMQMGE